MYHLQFVIPLIQRGENQRIKLWAWSGKRLPIEIQERGNIVTVSFHDEAVRDIVKTVALKMQWQFKQEHFEE